MTDQKLQELEWFMTFLNWVIICFLAAAVSEFMDVWRRVRAEERRSKRRQLERKRQKHLRAKAIKPEFERYEMPAIEPRIH